MSGACYAPTEIYNTSIMLTHWGRKDLEHSSNTGWDPDNYNNPVIMKGYQETDWREIIKGHPCYTPGADVATAEAQLHHVNLLRLRT